MPIEAPSADHVMEIAASFGMDLTEDDAKSFAGLLKGLKGSYDRLDRMVEPKPEVKYARTTGAQPSAEKNPHNAWAWKSTIKGASKGVLAGKKIAVKDNVCVAGLPMRNGSRVLENYVPDVDATVITRILDAGGTILGKTVCEDLCFSGGSHTSKPAPVRNPRKPTHSAGGSSSGSAAVIATGEVDAALGGDQGGSIRMPACWTGVYGLKATHGLVPYTGVMPIEPTLDHCGPMGATVEDVARLLTAIAGPDHRDPRQIDCKTQDYLSGLQKGVKGLKIAVVKEGFDCADSQAAVDRKVKQALQQLVSRGAKVEEVSIPMHTAGFDIWSGIIVEGATETMIKGNGLGHGWEGTYTTSLLDAYARGWRSRPNDMAETVKMVLFMGEYLHRYYHGRYYAKAQNLKWALRQAYDDVLAKYDLLAMPTVRFVATPIPDDDRPREEYIARALDMVANTCPFDASGHPGMNVPCGMEEGLPVGLMLVGRRYDEATILRAAAAFEKLGNWMDM
ncbi:amidase [soil metagenome]